MSGWTGESRDGMGWDGMGYDEMSRVEMSSAELRRTEPRLSRVRFKRPGRQSERQSVATSADCARSEKPQAKYPWGRLVR